MNRYFYISIIFCLFLSISSVWSVNRKELERQRKELQKEISSIKSLLAVTQNEGKDLLNQLEEINLQISQQTKLVNAFKAEATALNNEINTNETAINALQKELDKLKKDYADMIYKSYKSKSQQSRMMFILSSDNFYQAYKRLQYMKQYTDFRKTQGEQIAKKALELDQKNEVLKQQQKEKEQLIAESKEEQKLLEEKKQDQEIIVAQIKEKEKDYIKEINTKQKEEEKLDKKIEKIIRDAIAKSNGTSGSKTTKSSGFKLTAEAKLVATQFEGNKDKLPWPVEKGFVSRRYGKQNHPTLSGIVIESNGVHITTEKGAKARAIFKGKVLQIQSISGKKAVYIQHGNYITVYNNLETVEIKKGDAIDTKQVLGKVYTNKISNKTILKFQIWKNTQRLNPASWIYKM